MAEHVNDARKRDIGWDHGEMIDNNRLWTRCKYCAKEMKGSGVSRLKQHITGGYSNVGKCRKCPANVSRKMREHLDSQKKENEEAVAERITLRETLMDPIRRRHGIVIDIDDEDNSEDDLSEMEREQLAIAKHKSVRDIGGAPGTSRFYSHSKLALKEKSVAFGNKRKKVELRDMDSSIYRRPDCLQKKIPNIWKGDGAFKAAKDAIGKWFIFSNIPPNAANPATNPYFHAMIDEITRVGVGVRGPTPYEIIGPILDAEIIELKEYVDNFMKKWEVYGVTIMCDGWSSTTKLSIINFLIYCDGKIVFHKLVNASSSYKDANYIYELMDDVVEEIGEKYVVQVVTDNGSAYKKVGALLMRKRKHLYWNPCAAHCIDLILEDFAIKNTVKEVIEKGKKLSNFIYNHSRVLDMMRTYTNGKELLRPGATRFATNYISIQSILDQKANLQRMFTSEEWSSNPASRGSTGRMLQDTILSSSFWDMAKKVCLVHEPVSKVLRIVDGEKQATMGYVIEGMRKAKLAISSALPRASKKYCDIIDSRMGSQMIMDIHHASYYLNLAFHYDLELSNKEELLDALKRVIQRIEPDVELTTKALAEGKNSEKLCMDSATLLQFAEGLHLIQLNGGILMAPTLQI